MENEKKFCANCGAELEADAAFCGSCGTKVEAEKEIQKNTTEGTNDGPEAKTVEDSLQSNQVEKENKIAEKAPEVINQPASSTPKEKRGGNRKVIGIFAAVVFLLAVAGGIFAYVNSLPKSILGNAKISFTGYNHQGYAEFKNYSNVYNKELDIIAKKVGLSSDEVKEYKNGTESSEEKGTEKWQDFEKYIEDVKISFNKSINLSNNDKVILSISTSLKDNPIKAEKKSYTVKGLKKSTTYTTKDVLKSAPITVSGFNHFGNLNYNDSIWTTSSNDGSPTELTNGDKISFSLSSEYINQQKEKGKVLSGKDTTTITVSNLADSPKISNLNDLLTQEDTLARAANKSTTGDFGTTYTLTRLDTYFVGTDISSNSWYNDSDSGNNDNTSSFSVVTIYKIIEHNNSDDDSSNDTTNYIIYGYTHLSLKSDKVDVSNLTDDDKYTGSSNDTQQGALDDLKSDYPAAVKLN